MKKIFLAVICVVLFSGFVITEKDSDGVIRSRYYCETQADIDAEMLEAPKSRTIYKDGVQYRGKELTDKERLVALESKVVTLETASIAAKG